MDTAWFRYDEQKNLLLKLYIQPGAKATEVVGGHGDSLKIKIASTPVDGKANATLIKFLAIRFEVPISAIAIQRGDKSRHKVILIKGAKHPCVLLAQNEMDFSGK